MQFFKQIKNHFKSAFDGGKSAEENTNKENAFLAAAQNGQMDIVRKLLINGGDLAYPDPTPHSYEKRFFQ